MRKTTAPAPVELPEHPLRLYRRKHEMSQEELAQLAGTTKATISRIEGGTIDPTAALMRRLVTATKFQVTADMLIAWSPPPEPDRKSTHSGEATANQS